MKKLVIAFVTLFLIACVVLIAVFSGRGAADLEVGQISQDFPQYPVGAIPYSLSRKTFNLTTTTTVTGCLETASGEEIHGTTALVVTTDVTIDPSQQYYLYFDSATRAKNLDYDVEVYDNGTLKSLTASIKDQVAPIVAAVTGSLVSVARSALAVGSGGRQPSMSTAHCKFLSAAIGKSPSDPRLILQQEDRWTVGSQDSPLDYAIDVDLRRLKREFNLIGPRWAVSNAVVNLEPFRSSAEEPTEINFAPPDCPRDADSCGKQRPPLVKGLILRDAAPALMTASVCDAACNGTTLMLTKMPARLEMMPQFGARFLVPVHSGFAQDASVDIAISADGVITKLRSQNTSALANSISTIGGQAASLVPNADEAQPSTASANKKLADCLSAQAAVRAAGGTPIGTCQ